MDETDVLAAVRLHRTARLVPPDVAYRRSFAEAMAEDPTQRSIWFPPGTDPAEPAVFERFVIEQLADQYEDTPRAPGRVPSTALWWVDGEEFLGRLSIRHRLVGNLVTHGGHIGYWVRPSARRRGHATAALMAALPYAYRLDIDPVLVTCDDDNVASRRVIEKAGGVYENRIGVKLRYWVPSRCDL